MMDTCRICDYTGSFPVYRAREMMYGSRESFDYFQCTKCSCLQISQIPSDLARHYPADYYSYNPATDARWLGRARRLLNAALARKELLQKRTVWSTIAESLIDTPRELTGNRRLLEQLGLRSLNASFLDVGCGSRSWWLDELSVLGFRNLYGLDPFIKESIDYRHSKIIKGELDGIDGRYDVITFHHSLEHIGDQGKALASSQRLLNRDGVVVVRIPTVTSAAWREYGVDWVELDAPRHLYLHSHSSLKLIANRAGLDVVGMYCDSVEFEFWGSEQYKRDIPLRASDSFYTNPANSVFSYRDMAEFQRKTKVANENLDGGRVVALLRRMT